MTTEGRARRRFLRGTAAGAAGVVAFPMVARAQPVPVSIRLHGAWQARDIHHEYALDFGKKVNDMSGGRLRIEVYPAGAVAKPHDLLEATHKGVIDGCHATPALWHARNAAFSMFGAGPALGMDANGLLAWLRYGGGMTLFTELIERQLQVDVTPLFTGPMPAQPLGRFRQPLASSTALKGLRVQASGLAAELFAEMGARTQTASNGDVAELANASNGRWLEQDGTAKHVMLQSYHRAAEAFVVLFNRKKFEALPADLQAVVRHAADAASADMSWKALHRYAEDQAWMRDRQGVRFHKTPAEVLRAQMKGWSIVVARAAKNNPFVERIWWSQLAWAKRTVGWVRENLPDPAAAYDFWFAEKRR